MSTSQWRQKCVICGGASQNSSHGSSNPNHDQLKQCGLNLLKIFLKCLTQTELNNEFCDENNCISVRFCLLCTDYLTEWNSVNERIDLLQGRASQVKWTIVAKILRSFAVNAAVTKESEIKSSEDLALVGAQESRLLEQIVAIKSQFRCQFDARVGLEKLRLPGGNYSSGSLILEEGVDFGWENSYDGFDESVGYDHEEDSTFDRPNQDLTNPVVPESTKRKQKFRSHDVKTLNANEFIYRDKYHVQITPDGSFLCTLCQAKRKRRRHIYEHIRDVHVKMEGKVGGPLRRVFNHIGDSFTQTSRPHKDSGVPRNQAFAYPQLELRLIGPNKYSYAGHKIYRRGDKYECGTCSALLAKRGSVRRHVRLKHLEDCFDLRAPVIESSNPNEFLYLGKYKVTITTDGLFACSLCEAKRKRRKHIYEHIREIHLGKKRNSVSILDPPIKIERAEELQNDPEGPGGNDGLQDYQVSGIGCDVEFHSDQSVGAEDADPLGLNDQEDEASDDETNPAARSGPSRNLRVRRSIPAEVIDLSDEDVSSSDEDGDALAGPRQWTGTKFDDWVDSHGFRIQRTGLKEWTYAERFKVLYKEDIDKYYCVECSNHVGRRGEMFRHVRKKHIENEPRPCDLIFRQTGPGEYLYRDEYKVIQDNDKWICATCNLTRGKRNGIMDHIRICHIMKKKSVPADRSFREIAANEFEYHNKYRFRFDTERSVYCCALCDYDSPNVRGVLPHIRLNHFTDEEKLQVSAIEVAPGEYLYAGKYPIKFSEGRYRCGLCKCHREEIFELYGHMRQFHAEANDPPATAVAPSVETEAAIKSTDATSSAALATESSGTAGSTDKEWEEIGEGKFTFRSIEVQQDEEGRLTCIACGRQEADRSSMVIHIRMFHVVEERRKVNRSRPVPDVSKTDFEYMGVPFKYIAGANKYACSLCESKKACRRTLQQHIKRHHVEPERFVCDICGLETHDRNTFRKHRSRHQGAKHTCHICGKAFTDLDYLRAHIKIHIGEEAKKFQCEYCGKKFFTKKQFSNHIPVHTGEKPFPCDLCGERFSNTFKRRDHRKKYHDGLPQTKGWRTDFYQPPEAAAGGETSVSTECTNILLQAPPSAVEESFVPTELHLNQPAVAFPNVLSLAGTEQPFSSLLEPSGAAPE